MTATDRINATLEALDHPEDLDALELEIGRSEARLAALRAVREVLRWKRALGMVPIAPLYAPQERVVDLVEAYFEKRANEPATIRDIAEAIGRPYSSVDACIGHFAAEYESVGMSKADRGRPSATWRRKLPEAA